MKLIRTIEEIKGICKGDDIGLVPTMGYLHEGHASLIKRSVKENEITIVSIFINPTQFLPGEDLSTYPRNLDADLSLCESLGVDYIFAPEAFEIYPTQSLTKVYINDLSNKLCGITRPGHFSGVCLVVLKLFNIIRPTNAYFGSKDFQQLAIVKQMVKDLNIPVNIVRCPIIREKSGLALSSRNSYLTEKEKENALVLYEAITYAINSTEDDVENLKLKLHEIISKKAKVDYIEIVDIETLSNVSNFKRPSQLILAAYVGNTRLIDNSKLEAKEK